MTNSDSTINHLNNQTDTNYLTVEEIAYKLQIHKETARRFMKSGQIKAFKIPGRGQWRVSPADFQTFLDSMETNQ